MQAMIFAAGLGTRLRPLTHETPKPLVEVGGVPMLERVARRLIDEGVERLVINVHHLGEQVEAFVRARDGFGVETFVVQEPGEAPLETGGGLANAAPHFLRDRPILVHNSDILTDIPLADLYRVHLEDGDRLATLAVMERETSRHLLFDDVGLLGWANVDTGQERRVREPQGEVVRYAFSGVHVVSPRVLDLFIETGAFPIFGPYLRMVAAGERIAPHRVDGQRWIDIGTHDDLERARRWVEAAA
jgi:NDP-sugar pyrophosphorylase family protein